MSDVISMTAAELGAAIDSLNRSPLGPQARWGPVWPGSKCVPTRPVSKVPDSSSK